MLTGVLVLIIGIIGLILSQVVFKGNDMLSAGFFGFGIALLIAGILVILVTFWRIAHIEYGF
jgi:hypothetical protein